MSNHVYTVVGLTSLHSQCKCGRGRLPRLRKMDLERETVTFEMTFAWAVEDEEEGMLGWRNLRSLFGHDCVWNPVDLASVPGAAD